MRVRASLSLIVAVLVCTACFGPSDRRPGMKLSGRAADYPADWSFTDAHQEIAIEVSGFLGLPHSVTIWCASMDGDLYLGARDPESKRWPAWTDADPNVRLRIDGKLYDVRLTPLEDAATLERLRPVYAKKYDLPALPPGESPPPSRYWRVGPRG
jgi:hypothetical protein